MGLHRHFNFCTRDTPPLSDIWKEQRVIKGCWIVQTATFSYICWMNYFDECRLLYCSWFPAHFAHLSDRQQPINHQMHLFLILVVANWINSATFSSLYLDLNASYVLVAVVDLSNVLKSICFLQHQFKYLLANRLSET